MRTLPAAQATLGTLDVDLQELVIDLFEDLADDADVDPPRPLLVHARVVLRSDGPHVVKLWVEAVAAERRLDLTRIEYHPPESAPGDP